MKRFLDLMKFIIQVSLFVALFLFNIVNIFMFPELIDTFIPDNNAFVMLLYLLLGPIVFFVLALKFQYRIRKHYWKKLFGGFVLYITLTLVSYNLTELAFHRFTTYSWNSFEGMRIFMIDDFESRYDVVGMDRESILRYLGKPYYSNEDEYYYKTGSGFPDPLFYYIEFNNDRVISTGVGEK